MKLFLVSIALLGCVALLLVSPRTSPASAAALVKSKVEPKEVVLSKDSKDPKAKPVLLTHEAHSTKMYARDLKSVMSCAECHHTDQPKSALTGVLKTSERDVLLTSALLKDAAAAPVKTCRECHAQEGQKPTEWAAGIPKVKYPDEDDEIEITNAEAYHRNCKKCHEDAVIARGRPGGIPFIKGKPPTGCAECHKGS